jgi:ribonuclease HI
LCEAQAFARANRLPLADGVAAELADLERQLTALLEAAENGKGDARLGATPDSSESRMRSETSTPMTATVFTDGSAEGNPGPGGYGAIVRIPGRPDHELSGGVAHTTNNKMELTAAIVGLEDAIGAGAQLVTVVTDSEYLVKGMTRWLNGWKSKNWRTSEGQPVKNRELWERLDELGRGRSIQWQWIRGHAGHPENERCDFLATRAAHGAAQTS